MQTNLGYESRKSQRAILSRHAQKRMAQRGFTDASVKLIQAFGETSYDSNGAIRYLMTRAAVEKVGCIFGRSQKLDALAGAYVVLSADDAPTVITVSHRYK
jgi:hypothetical protein